MPVTIRCDDPKAFLAKLKAAMTGDKKKIETWTCDKDGDFQYAVDQYQAAGKKAWMRPAISAENSWITVTILAPEGQTISNEIQAIHEGRFIEMLLSHFRGQFTWIAAQ